MPTRCYICEEKADGKFYGIYCHSDGYLTYTGAMLLDHYNSSGLVDSLLSFGELVCLGEKLIPDPTIPHNLYQQQEDVCLFYSRDVGEKGKQEEEINLSDINDSPIDFCYVFTKDKQWKYFRHGELKDGLKPVQEGLDEVYRKYGFPRPEGYYGFYTPKDIQKRVYDFRENKGQEAEK